MICFVCDDTVTTLCHTWVFFSFEDCYNDAAFKYCKQRPGKRHNLNCGSGSRSTSEVWLILRAAVCLSCLCFLKVTSLNCCLLF